MNEKYMDMITGELAYDPVRLPVEQDIAQALYNRKTLETIWETNHEAQNPYTRQWFDMKSVIPQTELRREMAHYIELHKNPSDADEELDVIGEYTVILDDNEMKQQLKMLRDYISERLIKKKQYWLTIWKKINLLRLCCQFHEQNIQTFRSLRGFTYFKRLISYVDCILKSDQLEDDIKELGFLDVCNEIMRAIDVIGLRTSNIEEKSSMGFSSYMGLMAMLGYSYANSWYFMKFQSRVLRFICKTFDQMTVDFVLGDLAYRELIRILPVEIALNMLSREHANEISSEDLNNGIGILKEGWILSVNLNPHDDYLQVLANVVTICIVREIPQKSQEISGFMEGQLIETRALARHNTEALEKGLWVIKDIVIDGGPLGQTFQDFGGSSLVTEIVGMFKRFTEVKSEDKKNEVVICPKGCKTLNCLHMKIAQHGLGIAAEISKGGPPRFDIEVVHKFLRTCHERARQAVLAKAIDVNSPSPSN